LDKLSLVGYGAKMMENHQYIVDKGLFTGKDDLDFSLPESFEFILNSYNSLKEQRKCSHPSTPGWENYIQEVFHILGFNLEKQSERLFTLRGITTKASPKVILGVILPGENFEEMVPGLDWVSYLFFAAHYYQINWGISTNGLQLKMFRFSGNDYQSCYLLADIEGILKSERLDCFFTLYKIFAYLKGFDKKHSNTRGKEKTPTLLPKTKHTPRLGQVPKALLNILNVCTEVYEHNLDYRQACLVITQRKNLSSEHTVPDACTRRIGLNTAGFRGLLKNKSQLMDHLIVYYPNYSEEIKKVIG
jgi:hypothetical protein